ncbi:Uu.00g122320.m01.CDS01 [Anthostomella pinea]|uniref:Uu.00g122320.m01.CDS01 n=1 Tax=Anthostomella pinea TaxID=933095 RepID=A0AAI8VH36_9PEZI|nr:Uu.00g122320.m01.CDS01 [Anthostomella pinea]
MDNLARLYLARFQSARLIFDVGKVENALDILFDMRLQPDINMIIRCLVNLAIGRCRQSPRVPDAVIIIRESWVLSQEAAIIQPSQTSRTSRRRFCALCSMRRLRNPTPLRPSRSPSRSLAVEAHPARMTTPRSYLSL